MGQVKGNQATFALFEEDTFGSDPSTPDGQKIYCTNFGLQRSKALHSSQTLNASRGKERPVQGNEDVGGSIGMELSAQGIGTLLKHAMGSNSTSGAGPYVHTLTCDSLPTGLTLEKDHGSEISGSGRYEKFNGVKVNSMTLTAPQDGFATLGIDVLGATGAYDSSALDSSLTDNGHTSFGAGDLSVIEEGGSAIAYVQSASITLSNELDSGGYVLGSSTRRHLAEGTAMISGTISALFESMDLLNKAVAGTSSSLKLTYSRGDGLGSAGNESIEFLVQQLEFGMNGTPVDGPNGLLIELPFEAYRSGSDSGLQITLKNAVATI